MRKRKLSSLVYSSLWATCFFLVYSLNGRKHHEGSARFPPDALLSISLVVAGTIIYVSQRRSGSGKNSGQNRLLVTAYLFLLGMFSMVYFSSSDYRYSQGLFRSNPQNPPTDSIHPVVWKETPFCPLLEASGAVLAWFFLFWWIPRRS